MRFPCTLLSAATLVAATTPVAAQTTYPVTGTGPTQVAYCDLDGDSYPEIITLNAGSNSMTVMANQGDGTFGTTFTHPLFGKLHAIGATKPMTQLSWFWGLADGFGSPTVFRGTGLPSTFKSHISCPCTPGTAKMAVHNSSGQWVLALRGTPLTPGALYYGATQLHAGLSVTSPARQYIDVATVKVDNDHRDDVVALMQGPLGDEILVFRSLTSGGVSPIVGLRYPLGGTNAGAEAMWCGDLDQDGREDDVVVARSGVFPSFTNELVFIIDLFTSTTFTVPIPGSFAIDVEVTDFDNSGDLDAIVLNGGSGDVVVMHDLDLFGAQGFQSSSTVSVGTNPVSMAVADLNGDTVGDLVVVNRGSNDITVQLGGTLALAQPYGAGCAGTGGLIPGIATTGLPTLNNSTFSIDLFDALGNTPHILLAGAAPASLPLGGSACTVHVAIALGAFAGLTSAAGTGTLPLPIPFDPTLLGGEVYFQWAVIDPQGAYNNELAMSDALHVRIGAQ